MANGTTPAAAPGGGSVGLSPDDFAKLWAKTKGAPAAKPTSRGLSPEEFKKVWAGRSATAPAPEAAATPAAPKMGILGEEVPKDKESWTEWGVKRGAELLGNIGGGALGGLVAAPAALVEAGTIAGIPLAAATEWAAIRGGEAAGQTAVDVGEAYYDQWKHGTKANITPGTVLKDFAYNIPGTVAGGIIGHFVPKGVSKILGRDQLEATAREAGEAGAKIVTDAQEALGKGEVKATQAADEAIAQAKVDLAGKVRPQAIEEARARSLGRTPESAVRASQLPADPSGGTGIGAATRAQKFVEDMHAPKNRIGRSFDDRFENTFKNHHEKIFDPSKLKAEALNQIQYAEQETAGRFGEAERRVFSPEVRGLLTEGVNGVGRPEETIVHKVIQKGPRGGNITVDVPETIPEVPGNVRNLLNYRSRVGEAMTRADGPDLMALHKMDDAVTETLGDMKVPGAQLLRSQYRGFKGAFGHDFDSAIRSATKTEPSNILSTFFDPKNPQRATQWLAKATPAEKATMRDFFADAVNLKTFKPTPAIEGQLRQMGFTGALSKSEPWMVAEKITNEHLPRIIGTNPGARAAYVEQLQNVIQKERTTAMQSIVDLAERKIPGLPAKTGNAIKAEIEAAPTLLEKSQIASKAFQTLDPQRQAQIAGGEALQKFTPKDGPFYGMLKRQTYRAAALGVPMAVLGHPYLAIAGLLSAGPVAIREGLRKAWLASVRESPEVAEKFYQDLINPGTRFAIERNAQRMVSATLTDVGAHLGKDRWGDPLQAQAGPGAVGTATSPGPAAPTAAIAPPEPATTPKAASRPGRMAKAIDRHEATQIASDRGRQDPTHLDQVQNLNKQIASRGAPDIHNDLSTGRLSNQEVRKMVEPGQADVASMFKGMDLPTAMDAFDKGTDEEKELALAALVQKLNDEGRNLPPAQRRSYMARLRQALPQEVPPTEAQEGAMA